MPQYINDLLHHADGDGLPHPENLQLRGPLFSPLDVMALDTGILIANYEQVCSPESACVSGVIGADGMGAATILSKLNHSVQFALRFSILNLREMGEKNVEKCEC